MGHSKSTSLAYSRVEPVPTIADALGSHLGDNPASTPTPKAGLHREVFQEVMALRQEIEDRGRYQHPVSTSGHTTTLLSLKCIGQPYVAQCGSPFPSHTHSPTRTSADQ